MTQHTDMGGLTRRLNQAADDLVSGATIFSDRVHSLLIEAAYAIEALSIPPGFGEEELERAARKAFITFAVEQGCATTLSGLSISKTAFDAGFRAALTSARAQ